MYDYSDYVIPESGFWDVIVAGSVYQCIVQ